MKKTSYNPKEDYSTELEKLRESERRAEESDPNLNPALIEAINALKEAIRLYTWIREGYISDLVDQERGVETATPDVSFNQLEILRSLLIEKLYSLNRELLHGF